MPLQPSAHPSTFYMWGTSLKAAPQKSVIMQFHPSSICLTLLLLVSMLAYKPPKNKICLINTMFLWRGVEFHVRFCKKMFRAHNTEEIVLALTKVGFSSALLLKKIRLQNSASTAQ